MVESRTRAQKIADNAELKNIYYLENSTIEFPELNLYIAGCTLWTNVSAYTFDRMNDKTIKINKNRILPTNIRNWHQASADFIEKLPILKDNNKWILITHHCPFLPCQVENIPSAILDDGYYTKMDLNEEKFSHVIYGHNHLAANNEIKGVKYLSNPFCYPDELEKKKSYNQYAHFTIAKKSFSI